MPDDPANALRGANLVVIPAILVRQGDDPGPALRGLGGHPVEIACRIELTAPASRTASAPGPASGPAPGPVGGDRWRRDPADPSEIL